MSALWGITDLLNNKSNSFQVHFQFWRVTIANAHFCTVDFGLYFAGDLTPIPRKRSHYDAVVGLVAYVQYCRVVLTGNSGSRRIVAARQNCASVSNNSTPWAAVCNSRSQMKLPADVIRTTRVASLWFTFARSRYRATACKWCNVKHRVAKAFLFVKRVRCDKTKETCVHILIPHERTFILVFRREEWLVGIGGRPLVPEILGQTDPIRAKRRFSMNICS